MASYDPFDAVRRRGRLWTSKVSHSHLVVTLS